jgi:hypothetical protein
VEIVSTPISIITSNKLYTTEREWHTMQSGD